MGFQVFLNGTLVTDSGEIPNGLLIARDGRIEYAGRRDGVELPPQAERIDADGRYIAPGFVDIHVHGGGGSDFMDATDTDIDQAIRYHLTHGTTALCPTTATAPLNEILAALDALDRYRSRGAPLARALGAHIEIE